MLGLTMAPLCLRTAAPTVPLVMAQLLKIRTVGVAASALEAMLKLPALRLQLRKALS